MTTLLRWSDFLCWNALEGLLWATGYGLLGYLLGSNVYQFTGPVGYGLLGLGGCIMLALFVLLHKRQRQWEAEALRMFPGPLEAIMGSAAGYRQRQKGTQPSTPVSLSVLHEADDAHQAFDGWSDERTLLVPGFVPSITSFEGSAASKAPVAHSKHGGQSMPGRHLHPIRLEPFSTTATSQKGHSPR